MKLSDKRILFIAPAFFGYEDKIVEKLLELGAEVDFFDERSIKSSFAKAILKLNPQFFHKRSMGYYNLIIQNISKMRYDFVFVIKCEMMPIEIIIKLKSIFFEANFCLYLYDSLKNIKGIEKKLNYFDRVLSFDMEDTIRNSNLIFRPLFYIDDFKRTLNKQKEYEYDFCFIGTIHSDRYRVIKKIKDIADKNNFKYFFYCYLQSKFIYYFYKITKKEFKGTNIVDFEFNKIQSRRIADVINKTRVVLDVQHPKQTGLTMRTIEMIGMHKKLITTNQSIKNYDFYNYNNIAIIDRNVVKIPEGFFDKPYTEIENAIYNKYSIENWIIDVLGV